MTLTASGTAAPGTTYTWNTGIGTVTGFGPYNVVYPNAGPFTVTLTVSTPDCDALAINSTAQVTPNVGGGCCPSGIRADHLLGGVGLTTTLKGGATYIGTYRVLGNLVLTGGDYTLTPGTIFYVDGYASRTPLAGGGYQRTVSGSTITVGDLATLTVNNATLTASGGKPDCPMWGGLVVGEGGHAPDLNSVQYRLRLGDATISHALCGVRLTPDAASTGTAYYIGKTTFRNNLTHVYDTSDHLPGQNSYILDCLFDSNADDMHFPYDAISPFDRFITYQALFLAPTTKGPATLQVGHSDLLKQVYGIVNNLTGFNYGGIDITGNILVGVYGTGIWTMDNTTAQAVSMPTVSGNDITLEPSPTVLTVQINPAAPLYGIVSEAQNAPDALTNNIVNGQDDGTAGPGSYRRTVGLSVAGRTSVRGSRLTNLAQGMLTAGLDDSDIFDNPFRDCADGFVVQANTGNVVSRLGCNSFLRDRSTYPTRGIVVEQYATINDIGSDTSPAANKFDGMDVGIQNDNASLTLYYRRIASNQEIVSTQGSGSTIVLPAANQPNPTTYCSGQGANNGVTARGLPPSPEYLATIMDTVRRQLAPPARCRNYLHQITTCHRDAQQLAALEAWWQTLLVPNAPAYRTVGCFLLLNYDQQPTTATDAQRVLASLQPQALLDAELAAHLQLRAVVRHLPQTMPSLTAADSTVLRALAWGGTSSALSAGRWLRYFHPWLLLPTTPTTPALRPVASRSLAVSGAMLGAAYPNPAQTEVCINCRLAQGGQAAELRFTNLLTGQLALVVPVEGAGTERSQRVALQTLPAGQYAYQLLVDGQLVAAPQKLIVNP